MRPVFSLIHIIHCGKGESLLMAHALFLDMEAFSPAWRAYPQSILGSEVHCLWKTPAPSDVMTQP